jgi:hypothetical protein
MPSTILGTQSLTLPVGTTAERPASPTNGMWRKNSTTGYIEYWDPDQSTWIGIGSFAANSTATVTTAGSYTYHTFTSSGTFTVSGGIRSGDVLVVAGGGAGGGRHAGGGGAGGYISQTVLLSAGIYSVTVGGGGSGIQADAGLPTNGNNSIFGSLYTAIGGGRGGQYSNNSDWALSNGASGGSGGGGSANQGLPQSGSGAGGSGTSGQGNSGGNNTFNASYPGAGGGGAGAAGNANSGTTGGAGGAGLNWQSLGTFYAGGGGGSSETPAGGPGGNGGGGAGDNGLSGPAISGTANRGGGGGGSRTNASPVNASGGGGNGGSGIVIVRYLT